MRELHQTRATPELLTAIVKRLAPDTRVEPHLFAAHSGNIREALRALYDEAAGLHQTNGYSSCVSRE